MADLKDLTPEEFRSLGNIPEMLSYLYLHLLEIKSEIKKAGLLNEKKIIKILNPLDSTMIHYSRNSIKEVAAELSNQPKR